VQTTSESDLITCIRIIELESLLMYVITCFLCVLKDVPA